MRKQPPPPYNLSNLSVGNVMSFEAAEVGYIYTVLGIDTDRMLPLVRITASQVTEPGYPIVDKLNRHVVGGILLGTCEFATGEKISEGKIMFGRADGLAVEMVDDGEITTGVFPAPTDVITVI